MRQEKLTGEFMPAIILATPIQVDGRLAEFGITREQLIEVVMAMVAARAECTDNDPPSAPGWSSWRHGTRRAREIFRPLGWLKDDTDQLPTIVKNSLGMRIAVANTDDGAGLVSAGMFPQNRSKKGAATDRAVDLNQHSMFADTGEADESVVVQFKPRDTHSDAFTTFYLCVFNEGDDVRAEFSCPIEVVNGFFVGFSERIILLGPGDWPPKIKVVTRGDDTGSNGSEYDIPVRRK
jgi:hypothetical protein